MDQRFFRIFLAVGGNIFRGSALCNLGSHSLVWKELDGRYGSAPSQSQTGLSGGNRSQTCAYSIWS